LLSIDRNKNEENNNENKLGMLGMHNTIFGTDWY